MPRKKETLISLEVGEPNATWDYRKTKILKNFICKKDDAEKVVADMDMKEYWKHEKNYSEEVKSILATPGTRGASSVFFHEDVNVEEIKLPASVKPSTKYVYKIYDYSGGKVSTEYGTQKDILSYITKKIKTKYVYVTYNGNTDKVEYSPNGLTDILNGQEKTTSQIEIEPMCRSGMPDTTLIVAIFEYRVK